MSIMFNEICTYEEMLPKKWNIYIYIYIYTFWQHFFIDTYLIEKNIFCLHIFLLILSNCRIDNAQQQNYGKFLPKTQY